MANTYSSSLRLIIQQDGTNQGTWGGYTNTNIASLIEQAITGVGAITVSGSTDHTLTVTNGASDEARNAVLNITGTLSAAINVICPTAAKTYIVKNGTTGGFAITLKTSAGTGISVPNGETTLLYCDGTNVVRSLSAISGIPGSFTTLSASGAVSGVGFSNYLASPPAIGGTAAAAGAFTTLSASGVVSGVGFSNYLASPPAIGGTAAAAGTFTTLTATADSTFNSTGAVKVPVGTTGERPTGAAGKMRFNSTLSQFEGYNGTTWGTIGGGATGGGGNQVFYENSQIVTTSYTITSGKSASSTGPITINSGAVVTIPSGSRWVIL
jgi:hypothetical protein